MNPPVLDRDDIQGNVLAGFNTNVEVLLGLTAEPERHGDISLWLSDLAPFVTTVTELREQRHEMKAPLRGERTPLTWISVAIGSALLAALRRDLIIRDPALTAGFERRARPVFGDETDQQTWKVGGPNRRLDVLLIVACNDETVASERADELVADASNAGLRCTYRETAKRIADLEHFGFRDGVSQPLVRGYDPSGTIGPGHFIFGYEREEGSGAYLPGNDPSGLLPNGSLLVFRRLQQDVSAFRTFCRDKASTLQAQHPDLSAEHLAALLVGRWPNGALVSSSNPTSPGSPPTDNEFDFAHDHFGADCPLGAHIRKVNPRAGPKDVADVPRLLRRGIPFGPPFEEDKEAERGLAFISFQTSIKHQLEFLTASWMNSAARPGPNAGHDLLVGRVTGGRSMTIPTRSGPITVNDDGAQWITPTGGGYLFAPGRRALGRFAAPLARGVGWRAERALINGKAAVWNALSAFGATGTSPR